VCSTVLMAAKLSQLTNDCRPEAPSFAKGLRGVGAPEASIIRFSIDSLYLAIDDLDFEVDVLDSVVAGDNLEIL
jgi:hypothetical protein